MIEWGSTVSLPLSASQRERPLRYEGRVPSSAAAGTCHAVCAWVDFCSPAGGASDLVTRTGPANKAGGPAFGPSPWWQAVLFLPAPVELARREIALSLDLDLVCGGLLRGTVEGSPLLA